MGITIVLMFYAVAFTVVATFVAAVLGTAAYLLTKRSSNKRRAVVVSALFPYACVAFAAAWFLVYAVTNSVVFHRDPGLGDSWETPLPNGYALMMIDTTDQGTVYNPKTQGGYGFVAGGKDSEFGVRQLQVSGNLIFGARDTGYFGRIGQESTVVDKYFELDSRDNHIAEYDSLNELRQRAAARGIVLNLRTFDSVFSDYRTTWFDYVAGAVLLLIPILGFVLLICWVWRLRRSDTVGSV